MADTPRVRVYVASRIALTTTQAAERYGQKLSSMRGTLTRLRAEGRIEVAGHLDERTPVYLQSELDAAMKARPGTGANLRRKPLAR